MSKYSLSIRFVLISSLLCFMTFSAGMLWAQETKPTDTKKTMVIKKPTRASVQNLAIDPIAALQADIKQCGRSCNMGGPGSISAGGGTTLDYNCDENGNCSCFGSADCVAMAPICAEGTLGCNDQGCICEED
jgi:hypothetical protein